MPFAGVPLVSLRSVFITHQHSDHTADFDKVQAALLHSASHGYRPVTASRRLSVPMRILHGTADGRADGGDVNTQAALARDFEPALRQHQKPVEAHYYEGGGPNTFFTNSTQPDEEQKTMIAFLRGQLGA